MEINIKLKNIKKHFKLNKLSLLFINKYYIMMIIIVLQIKSSVSIEISQTINSIITASGLINNTKIEDNNNYKEIYNKEFLEDYLKLKQGLSILTKNNYLGTFNSNVDLPFLDIKKGGVYLDFELKKYITFKKEFYYVLNYELKFYHDYSETENYSSSLLSSQIDSKDYWMLMSNRDDNYIIYSDLELKENNNDYQGMQNTISTNTINVTDSHNNPSYTSLLNHDITLKMNNFTSKIEKTYSNAVFRIQ